MNDIPIFDNRSLEQLNAELGSENTAEVLQIFFADTGRKIDLCVASVQDSALVKREAHAIKSSAATFGFVELSRQARAIERDAIGMSAQEISDAMVTLREIFKRTSDFAQSVLLLGELENRR